MKTCFKCHKEKPLEEFYRHPEMPDGRLNKCKDCAKSDAKKRYNEPTAKVRIIEYERRRFLDPKRKRKILTYQRRRRARSPEKYKARQAVESALRSGALKRLPCEECGSEKVEAHHPDYSKPLLVRWLCRKHHLFVHKKEAWGQVVDSGDKRCPADVV